MSLTTLLLAIFLTLYALTTLGWVPVAAWVLGLFALATAIGLVIEGLGAGITVLRRKP